MRLILMLLALAMPGWAWQFTYSDTTAGAPAWNRPIAPPVFTSLIGTNVPYHSQTFVAPNTDTYTITSLATGGWDNFLVLYQGSFNPAAPLTNALAANDDFGFIGQSRIVRSLTAGTTYVVVTTGFTNSSFGSFTNTVSDTIPEPSTWMLLGAGVIWIAARRRGGTRPQLRHE
jgi:hypothetical protein